MAVIIKVAFDFSEQLGGRYISDGPYSGEEFRENILKHKYQDALIKDEKLIVNFDFTEFKNKEDFLDEAFGGMVRYGYADEEIVNKLAVTSLTDRTIDCMVDKHIYFALEDKKENSPKKLKYTRS